MRTSARLTIFEGPDGSGKSTAAKVYAQATRAKYVHFAALPRVGQNLGRIYVEAMLPALLGYQDVVFDRSWLSEEPYGVAFREGKDRLGDASRRMLERLALRCGAVMVRCQPPWEAVRLSYMARKHLEMLDNEEQLRLVYDIYQDAFTDLPEFHYDYTVEPELPIAAIDDLHLPCHPLDIASAGSWQAKTVLVGEAFAERKDNDAFYQWPFASFSNEGCSQWLTKQLGDVSEQDLLWINADQNLEVLYDLRPEKIVALGSKAYSELYRLKLVAEQVPHPQAFKRFNSKQRYPLLDII